MKYQPLYDFNMKPKLRESHVDSGVAMTMMLEEDETDSEDAERDQNKLGRDENKVKNSKKLFPPREQNK